MSKPNKQKLIDALVGLGYTRSHLNLFDYIQLDNLLNKEGFVVINLDNQ